MMIKCWLRSISCLCTRSLWFHRLLICLSTFVSHLKHLAPPPKIPNINTINWKIKQFIQFMCTNAIVNARAHVGSVFQMLMLSLARRDTDGWWWMQEARQCNPCTSMSGKMQRKMRWTCDFYILFSNFANVLLIEHQQHRFDSRHTNTHTHIALETTQ